MHDNLLIIEIRALREEVTALRLSISDGSPPRGPRVATPTDEPDGEWLTTEDVVALIGYHRQVVRDWCRKHIYKGLPGVRRDNGKHSGSFWIHEAVAAKWKGRYDTIMKRRGRDAS